MFTRESVAQTNSNSLHRDLGIFYIFSKIKIVVKQILDLRFEKILSSLRFENYLTLFKYTTTLVTFIARTHCQYTAAKSMQVSNTQSFNYNRK